jgi:hypothetical protein
MGYQRRDSRQPEQVRSFLLATSILARMTGPLCDAVTGQGGGTAKLVPLHGSSRPLSGRYARPVGAGDATVAKSQGVGIGSAGVSARRMKRGR